MKTFFTTLYFGFVAVSIWFISVVTPPVPPKELPVVRIEDAEHNDLIRAVKKQGVIAKITNDATNNDIEKAAQFETQITHINGH